MPLFISIVGFIGPIYSRFYWSYLKLTLRILGHGLSGPGISGPGISGPSISGPGISGPGLSGPGISIVRFYSLLVLSKACSAYSGPRYRDPSNLFGPAFKSGKSERHPNSITKRTVNTTDIYQD